MILRSEEHMEPLELLKPLEPLGPLEPRDRPGIAATLKSLESLNCN